MLAVTDQLTNLQPHIVTADHSGIYRIVPEFRSTLRRELIFWENQSQSSGDLQ